MAAIRAIRRATSATHLTHDRPGFGWRVTPAPGSILASPAPCHWDPEPDYFHHWIRDAAIVVKTWPEILAALPETERPWWIRAFHDHVAFSLRVSDPDRRGPTENPLKTGARDDHRQYLRPDAELAALTGTDWLEEPRVAADGNPDLERWGRPQDDGPALRASALIEVTARCPELRSAGTENLIARDLAHLATIAGRPALGPWEEHPPRRSTFTLIATWDALDRGARHLPTLAETCRAAAARIEAILPAALGPEGWREAVETGYQDSATLLALLHAGRTEGPFALTAPATRTTANSLETLFARHYPINRGRSAPAMGRWEADVFFDGNPWFPVTLGFAEYHYRRAALTGDQQAFKRGDAFLQTVRDYAPEGDDLPEQFHRETGAPTSSPALTWSSAAFLAAAAARQAVAR